MRFQRNVSLLLEGMEALRRVEFTGGNGSGRGAELGQQADLGEEWRRWRPHQVQGSVSEEGQSAVLSSHPEFKEPAVLGGPTARGVVEQTWRRDRWVGRAARC